MIQVRRSVRTILVWIVAGAFLVSSTGCQSLLTARLWNAPRTYSEPALQTHLEIYQKNPRLFFVSYRSLLEGSEKEETSIFALDATHPLENPYHPHFVGSSALQGLEKIPVVVAGKSPDAPVFALAATDGRSFVIHSGRDTFGPFVLPTFESEGSRQRRLFLTPAAVVGDIVIVSSVLGLILSAAFWPVGYSTTL